MPVVCLLTVVRGSYCHHSSTAINRDITSKFVDNNVNDYSLAEQKSEKLPTEAAGQRKFMNKGRSA